ncbi:flavodoxin family protein [Maridesulfovibrio salexigens]|uniref:NADPH-dependent FMN reductase n=1 Tax=Maridesulfovibrio salexigens (strain ATCC 14822 / DSM 2638 / NCIMB 8403 / VKM B-1763) TaxID=526222 RepID=C6BY94_MARSD|nr:flavodoxin family protein [Maridesulfovibrio salexigens]ACS78685.1 NADPH-dependent FMN reductase [Maridesulfovibrio salexigens DSM 2638]
MILGIEGSPRKKGNSHKMLDAVLSGASGKGFATEGVHLRDLKYDPCVGCEICRKEKACRRFEDDMTGLYPKLEQSKGLVLISPVHNYNVTAWMKAFIDRLYCYYDFEDTRPRSWSSRLAGQGRKAVIGAIAEQSEKKDMGFTIEAMRMPLEALGYEIVAELPVLRLFDRGIIADHQEIMDRARNAGIKLAAAISDQ